MAIIHGKKVAFQVLLGDDYVTVACGKSIVLRTETDVKETTTKGDGRYKDFDYKALSYTIDFEGVLKIQEEGQVMMFDFADYQDQFLEVNSRIVFTDETDLVKVFRGQQIVANAVFNATPAQIADGTVSLLGKGKYYLENSIPTFINLRLLTVGSTNTEFAKVKLRLLDGTGTTVWTSETLPEAVGGWLIHPLDITKEVPSGEYYYYFETHVETEENLFIIFGTPNHTVGFPIGISNGTSYPDDIFDFTEDKEVEWSLGPVPPPPVCVDVTVPGDIPDLPNGTEGVPYSYSFTLAGTPPFVVSNVTKPSWLVINLVETSPGAWTVQLSGTPDATGTDIPVSFDITNCSSGLYTINQAIDIVENPNEITVDYNFDEQSGANGSFRIYVNGVLIVSTGSDLTGQIIVNPGDTVETQITPTPGQDSSLAVEDVGVGVIYFGPLQPNSQSFDWVAEVGHTYEIIADISI